MLTSGSDVVFIVFVFSACTNGAAPAWGSSERELQYVYWL